MTDEHGETIESKVVHIFKLADKQSIAFRDEQVRSLAGTLATEVLVCF